MKVLITGADGYIGRALARRLAAPGATLQGRAIDQLTLCDLRLPEALLPDPADHAASGDDDRQLEEEADREIGRRQAALGLDGRAVRAEHVGSGLEELGC